MATSSQWHSVNPSTRPLTLTILELSPLALTLSLGIAPGSCLPAISQPKGKRHTQRDSDDESANAFEEGDGRDAGLGESSRSFKDLLSHGVVVTVNGQSWTRIVAHVSDEDGEEPEEEMEEESSSDSSFQTTGVTRRRPRRARFSQAAQDASKQTRRRRREIRDRAVVVVYGLTSGREYEIELRVVGFDLVSNPVVIPATPLSRSRANSLRRTIRSRANSVNAEAAPPPEPTAVLSFADSQIAQTRQLLAAAHAERDNLNSQIKEARRASQRAEAAIRQEIDSVRKAIEKASAMDMRAKQKALALQEQVKQAWQGAEAADAEVKVVRGGMSDLEARLEAAKVNLEEAKTDLKLTKDNEEQVRDRDRRARAEEDKKLAEVLSKIDKLRARREKKEDERVELEKRIETLELQRDETERRNDQEKHRRQHPPLNSSRGRFQPRFASTGRATANNFTPQYRPNSSPRSFNPNAPYFEPTTSLMPPQLQHRIYLPNSRPRPPPPNFHPPPSVVEQQQREGVRSSPTMPSQPSFPPLPGASATNKAPSSNGPSLASIVTRAVLSPTSVALNETKTTTPTSATQPKVTFAPPPSNTVPEEFPPLSPTGPWAALGPQHMVRTATPPAGWGAATGRGATGGGVGAGDAE